MNTRAIVSIVIASALSGAAGYFVGTRSASPDTTGASSEGGLRLHVLSTANRLDAALSTLNSLETGDMPTARQTLDVEVRSSLLRLEKMAPTISLSGKEQQLVNETIAKGRAYANSRNPR